MSMRIEKALKAATDTKEFVVGRDVLGQVVDMAARMAEGRPVMLVADPNTFAAAGRRVQELLEAAEAVGKVRLAPMHLFSSRCPHADDVTLAEVRALLEQRGAVALAVGSGTLNDLCKRASHELEGRPYMVVATAASVDGYASFGAPISQNGFKKTMPCAAPRAILADTDVLLKAPYPMTAAGYADLAAKVTGGSDWIIADVVGADPLREDIWEMTQVPLRSWLSNPAGLANGDADAIHGLFEGLTMTGFAMQAMHSSRPASGAEHLFSHVWEMSHVVAPSGEEPSHGFKVGIGTLATTRLTEKLFERDLTYGDIDPALAAYPSWEEREAAIRTLFGEGELAERIVEESRAKHLSKGALRDRLALLAKCWGPLRKSVLAQLIPSEELKKALAAAKCPVHSEDIGISSRRLAATALAAQMIRSRYTSLDLAFETHRLPDIATALKI